MSDISLGYRQQGTSDTIIYMSPEDVKKIAQEVIFGKFFTGTTSNKYMGDLEVAVNENNGSIMDLSRTSLEEKGIVVIAKLALRMRKSHYEQLLEIGQTESREDSSPFKIKVFDTARLNMMTGIGDYEYLLSLAKKNENGFIFNKR